jgi:hypothetical protein
VVLKEVYRDYYQKSNDVLHLLEKQEQNEINQVQKAKDHMLSLICGI